MLPIMPASTALSIAGGFAAQGYMNIYVVLLVSFLGSVFGNVFGYFLVRKYGKKILSKFSFFRKIMRSSAYDKVQDYVDNFAPSIVFFSRFLTELTPLTNTLAALSYPKVSFKSFFIFSVLGEIAYVILYGMAGFWLGSQWQNNIAFMIKAGLILFSLGIGTNLIQVAIYKKRKHVSSTDLSF